MPTFFDNQLSEVDFPVSDNDRPKKPDYGTYGGGNDSCMAFLRLDDDGNPIIYTDGGLSVPLNSANGKLLTKVCYRPINSDDPLQSGFLLAEENGGSLSFSLFDTQGAALDSVQHEIT